jgi:hypothetical protein
MSRFAARARTSSEPLVRTTLNGHSSANVAAPLLKCRRRGGPLLDEEEIAGPVELSNDPLKLSGGTF